MTAEERKKKIAAMQADFENYKSNDWMQKSLFGQGKFRDSGRASEGFGEAIDSLTGVPIRVAASELQQGNVNLDALKRVAGSIGTDPRNAPTGYDVASKVTDNPYLGAALATGVDMAGLPIPGMQPGIAGKVDDVGKASAKALLAKIGSAEEAVKLKGPAREAYLQALDTVYGDRAKRSADMGFGKKTWYHGTTVPVDEFKNEAKGLSTGAQSAKKGFFFAEDPSTASDYADLARDKGVIREGDKVTTRYLSDTADLHNEAYDKIKDLDFERREALAALNRETDRLKNSQAVLRQRKNDMNTGWAPEGLTLKDVEDSIADLEQKIAKSTDFIATKKSQAHELLKQRHAIDDSLASQGQNVLPVKLRAGDGKIHAKNYKGRGYRDSSYADEMSKAQEKGNSGVLFQNTYDAADQFNKVQQNIAAVFEPNQIRSTNAAFDPRFADSPLLLAGKAGVKPGGVNINLDSDEEKRAMREQLYRRLLPK